MTEATVFEIEPLIIAPTAIKKVQLLIEDEGNPDLMLRVFVTGGGCAGFQYGFTFDEESAEDDTVITKSGVRFVVDSLSVQYLAGSTVGYTEGLEGSKFIIENPSAETTCGCGSSFLFKSIFILIFFSSSNAEDLSNGDHQVAQYLAHIQAHSVSELEVIFHRADELFNQRDVRSLEFPIVLVLHGDEAGAFLRSNYSDYRDLVDQAARLEAFDVVDIQICETWMRSYEVTKDDLPAFIETVPYGPDREDELLNQGFEYF